MTLEDTGSGIQDRHGTEIASQLNAPEQAESHPDPRSADSDFAGFVGEGIGLTIVKRLCEILDAGICLESQPGRGTKVMVEFPLEYPES
jgi:signal transduction histidine kinase